jgi:predicted O-methyltransferase YrrM
MGEVLDKVRLSATALRIGVTRPQELMDRLVGRLEFARRTPDLDLLPTHRDPISAAHELLDVESCEACAQEIVEVEREVGARLSEDHRHDGGPALAQMVWTIVRHTHPGTVVETGVARGVSSAFILDALDRNASGNLWSIDLPPIHPAWRLETGSAVPERLRSRWTYIHGASRRHLPGLLAELGRLDMFVHDGWHTLETQTMEFDLAWPCLADRGVLICDDAQSSAAFVTLAEKTGREPYIVAERGKQGVVGLLRA